MRKWKLGKNKEKLEKIRKKWKLKNKKYWNGEKKLGKIYIQNGTFTPKYASKAPKTCLPLVLDAKSRGVADLRQKFFQNFEEFLVNRSTVQKSLAILDGRPISLKIKDFPRPQTRPPLKIKSQKKRNRQKS